MDEATYNLITPENGVPVKAWTKGVQLEEEAKTQLLNVAQLPFVFRWIAAMPDVHWGIGATIGSVIPTQGAIIPAAVGVDIGCGMMAVQTSMNARDLPDDLKGIRSAIEKAVPHGRTNHGGAGDRGAWHKIPKQNQETWATLKPRYDSIVAKHPKLDRGNHANHLGTLGTGNHFIEVCLDEADQVWFMLHSGSRGVGNRMGTYFIDLARKDMKKFFVHLPDQDLAYFSDHTEHFKDYLEAVEWAQDYARWNRHLMMKQIVAAVRESGLCPPFEAEVKAINCHHNYVARELHYGENILVTRKGAVRAQAEDWGIIPGSMGARSFIVRGKGNPESFCSCSHGAGRSMSRKEAKRRFSVEDHARMTAGVECRKDADVIDETPAAYKPIDAVIAAQADLIEVVHTLHQVVCVKGIKQVIELDGSQGEGGGQILRTALSLSLVTGKPFRIINIRAGRQRPGLLRQHLTAALAATEVSDAECEGAELGSTCLAFTPGEVKTGAYQFALGSAGSVTLVFQTILPALMIAKGTSRITIEGGTHNSASPPFEFLDRAFLPFIRQMGPKVQIRLDRYGFYPAGGGVFHAEIEPVAKLVPFVYGERGEMIADQTTVLIAHLAQHIAQRELAVIAKSKIGLSGSGAIVTVENSAGPGNVVMTEVSSKEVTEIFTSFGRIGVTAERVAREAIHEARQYLASRAVAGEHLTDQLLLPLAIAGGGTFTATTISSHASTNMDVISTFLPVRFEVTQQDNYLQVKVVPKTESDAALDWIGRSR